MKRGDLVKSTLWDSSHEFGLVVNTYRKSPDHTWTIYVLSQDGSIQPWNELCLEVIQVGDYE